MRLWGGGIVFRLKDPSFFAYVINGLKLRGYKKVFFKPRIFFENQGEKTEALSHRIVIS